MPTRAVINWIKVVPRAHGLGAVALIACGSRCSRWRRDRLRSYPRRATTAGGRAEVAEAMRPPTLRLTDPAPAQLPARADALAGVFSPVYYLPVPAGRGSAGHVLSLAATLALCADWHPGVVTGFGRDLPKLLVV